MGLHVEVSGKGPELALLHGWGMTAGVWGEMVQQLAPHFRVHSVDLPGHGGSAPCAPCTLDAVVDALADALPPRARVCGWSWGGQIALNWALRHPAQVERLVLIATTPCFVLGAGWECGIAASVLDDFMHNLAVDCRGALQRFVMLQAQGDTDTRSVLRQLRQKISGHGDPDIAALAAALHLLRDTDMRDLLPQVTQTALIVHGERDMLVPLATGAYLQRTLPRATLVMLAGAAHAPFIAQPQRVARHITEFCVD